MRAEVCSERSLGGPAGGTGSAEGGQCCFAAIAARAVKHATLTDRFAEAHLVLDFVVARAGLYKLAVQRCNEKRYDDVRFADLNGRFEDFAGDTSAAAEPVDEGSEGLGRRRHIVS